VALSPDLAAKEGLRIWSVVIAGTLAVYSNWKFSEGESDEAIPLLGAAIFSIMISWATDYYKGIYIGGALLALSVLMYFTSHNEGMLQPLLFWTGATLMLSAMLFYVLPITVDPESQFNISGYLIAVGIIVLVLAVDIHIQRYSHFWEIILIFGVAALGAFFAISIFGIDHAWYGLAMMYAALGLSLAGVYTKVVDPLFFAGLLIFMDDFIGHEFADPHPELMPLWFLLGFVGCSIYLFRRWME